jgi:hypothetical protein
LENTTDFPDYRAEIFQVLNRFDACNGCARVANQRRSPRCEQRDRGPEVLSSEISCRCFPPKIFRSFLETLRVRTANCEPSPSARRDRRSSANRSARNAFEHLRVGREFFYKH